MLRYNGAASSVILLPVDLPIRSWPVAIVTLKGRTINPVVWTFIDCLRDVSKPLAPITGAAATKGEVLAHQPTTTPDGVAFEAARLAVAPPLCRTGSSSRTRMLPPLCRKLKRIGRVWANPGPGRLHTRFDAISLLFGFNPCVGDSVLLWSPSD